MRCTSRGATGSVAAREVLNGSEMLHSLVAPRTIRDAERTIDTHTRASEKGASPAPYVLGRYTVYKQIAAGGLGSVHFGRLRGPSGFRRTVAIKRAHPYLRGREQLALMFIDEARLAARIRHPNVVSTLDVIDTATDLALVMDYVQGESLCALHTAAAMRGERVPLLIAASIMVGVLHGLHAAHEALDEQGKPLGIVHRDVSPQNILVGVDGIPRVVDFGIAKAAGRLQAKTDVSAIKGKYAYMAPEQVRGDPVSRLTDVFAASIVFWELVTGERLFEGRTDAETVQRVLLSRIRPASAYVADLPPEIDRILSRGLVREPDGRYASAREMALEIEACLPPVRLSEVGAWVERLAGRTLAKRAADLAEIERAEATDAWPQETAGPTDAPDHEPLRTEPQAMRFDVSRIAAGRDSTSLQATRVDRSAPHDASRKSARRLRRGLAAAVGAGACFVLAAGVWTHGSLRTMTRPSPAASAAARLPSQPSTLAGARTAPLPPAAPASNIPLVTPDMLPIAAPIQVRHAPLPASSHRARVGM
jgi:serine/threonine-protein kinase